MRYVSHSEEDTFAVAEGIAATLGGGEAIILVGELGAGKTTFTKGLARALGVERTVVSPTFTIVKEYRGKDLMLYHIDMYRLEDDSELCELGIDELFSSDSVVVIEWNRLGENELPERVITVNFTVSGENERILEVKDELHNH